MKKIFYLFAVLLGGIVTSCDPLEDTYEEIGVTEETVVGDFELTLSDDDYKALDLSYGNFSSVDDAKSMLPAFLTDAYPVLGKGSSALITYKRYSKVETYSENVYELSAEEHDAITGNTYGNFDKSYHIINYLEATYSTPSEGDFVSLRYVYYSGGSSTLTDGFAFENGEWTKITGFTESEYNDMGESYPNFTSHDEAAAKMPIKLLDVYKYNPKSTGDVVRAMYELYKGNGVTKSYTSNFVFDGSVFVKYDNEALETLQFGHDGTTWVPDNTIKYTITAADYTLVATSLANKYPSQTGSVGNYSNFDRRPGNAAEWTDDMLAEAFSFVLDNLDSGAADGQKYVVTFDIYNGSNGTESIILIKSEGVWVLN
ncbi:hypothetical protein [Maribacter sp.]|uniref:hypothetical protein n=1 Tax=Maribacter sp. TaxID=1897614 RepID=UPI0025C07055|nr:hypothetical protein [Maribacter sp.]